MSDNTSTKDRYVRWGILILGSIIVLAMAYGSGMRSQTKNVRAVDEQRKVAERDFRMAQRDLRLRLAVAQQLEGRRQVSLALLELDKRNFGAAQERLGAAVKQFQRAQAAGATIPDLSDASGKLAAINLTATPDTGSQRMEILSVVETMDKILTDFTPSFFENSAKTDAVSPIKKPTMNDVPVIPPPGNDVTRVK